MRLVAILTLTMFLAGAGQAELANRIDPTRKADVSNKIYPTNTIGKKTVPQPVYRANQTPLTQPVIQHQTVTHETLRFDTVSHEHLQFPTRTMPVHTATNFGPKRPVVVQNPTTLQLDTRPHQAAPVTKRVIRATTGQGQEELRQQLNRIPVPTHPQQ